ncbi:MAG TPA: hypothetical protein VFV54_00905 [Thermoanaerobaculia bacterium]|nr:hypothetical protein [Thermoanaerobaculia bacterium]
MNEADVVKELARRAALPEEKAAEALHALHELINEGAVNGAVLAASPEPPAVPPDDPNLVERLIARAKRHPLGLEFLASGLLATVAITLGAHAFTVEAARRRLRKEQQAKEAHAE